MNIILASMFGGPQILLIIALVVILFGAKKIPELAKGLGLGIKEFKKAAREVTDEVQNAQDAAAPVKAPATQSPSAPTVAQSQSSTPPKV